MLFAREAMPTVTSEIRRILKDKDQAIRSGVQAMRDLLKELHGQVSEELGRAALGSWDAYHLKQVLDSIETQMASFEAQARKEISGLLDEAWDKGKALVDAPLVQAGIYTGFHLSTTVLDVLKEYSNDYLRNLFRDSWYKIKGEINLGVLGMKTPQEVAKAIGKSIDAGRFKSIAVRAETITKTEMGRVFSEATELRMEQAADHVAGLEKEWRHVGHPKIPRLTHLAADGQHVPVGEPFDIGGVRMMFPRDPGAPLEETINCGCDHVPFHPRWG
jgi:hypothetical protein